MKAPIVQVHNGMGCVIPTEAKKIMEDFHLAVADYLRDGRPSRLLERVYHHGAYMQDAIDATFKFIEALVAENEQLRKS